MRAVLLGGNGFIGLNLALDLKARNYDVVIADCVEPDNCYQELGIRFEKMSFSKNTNYEFLIKENDIVYHFISIPSNDSVSCDVELNILSTLNLLDACVNTRISKLIFISSGGTIYGNATSIPSKETDPANPISIYALQKFTLENYLKFYNNVYGLHTHIIRLSNPYGPGQRPFRNQGIVPTILASILLNKEIHVWGDGNDIRDYIYIDDVTNLLVKIIDVEITFSILNVGSSKGLSVNDLIMQISKIMNVDPIVKYDLNKKTFIKCNILDISECRKLFPEIDCTSFEKGIRKTIESWDANRQSFDIKGRLK